MTLLISPMNPTGESESARDMETPLKQNVTSMLLDIVLSSDNMRQAWKRVKANRGAAGIDQMTLEDFPKYARLHWNRIRQEIEDGQYQPQAVRRVEIPKSDGGKRMLGIPTILDRVIQQAIAQILMPLYDGGFSSSSFGFRPSRNAHQAIEKIRQTAKSGYTIAVDIDLAKFFDTVNHDVLMNRLGRKILDKRLLALIGKYLRAGGLVGESVEPSAIGTPQGSPLSPLLANITLDELDKELERRGHPFARYADDIIVMVKSRRAGTRVMGSLTRFIKKTLKLTINESKSKVDHIKECSFLGFVFRGNKIRWSDKALADFKHRIRKLTGRSWGVSMEFRLKKLGEYLRGWMGYFGRSEYYRPVPELDEWIRRRVRMCYWKQWRWARNKIYHLLKLGVNLKMAMQHALNTHSYWHMARTPAVQLGLSNAWLSEQGLLSLKDLWCKAQGYTDKA
jgi:RNA-directed DNA polymerase